MSNPYKKRQETVKGFMSYLNGTRELYICFRRKEARVESNIDANYAGDMDKQRSTLGYVLTFIGRVVSWQSCLQDCVSMLTPLKQSMLYISHLM